MKITNVVKQVAMASVLLGLNSFVLAADSRDSRDNNNNNRQPTDKERMMTPMLGDKLPPYNNPNRYLMSASFIYWQADSDGFDIGTNEVVQGTSTGSGGSPAFTVAITDQMKEKGMDFKWDPGFTVGLGAIFGDRDQWDLFLNWTWLQSTAKAHQNDGAKATAPLEIDLATAVSVGGGVIINTDALAPEWVTGNPSSQLYAPATAYNTTGSWKLHYNTLDLELGRNFFLGKTVSLRPHIGLRAAWIHQHTKVNYLLNTVNMFQQQTSSAVNSIIDSYIGSSFSGNNEYDGLGLRAGLDMNWNFTNHFCVYGKVGGAILYGFYDVSETVTTTGNLGITSPSTHTLPSTLVTTLDTKFHRTRTNLQIATGLTWHTDFYNDKSHLFVSVGYEVNEWFQQNELRNISGSTDQPFLTATRKGGDLGLHGITVDVKFDF